MAGRNHKLTGLPMWWLYMRPDLWEMYAMMAARLPAMKPLIHGPPWEDVQ